MIRVTYSPRFLRDLKKLEFTLQTEAIEKVETFKNLESHRALKVHKLRGEFKNVYSFSVNYKYRILFQYLSKNEVALLTIGDHSVYD